MKKATECIRAGYTPKNGEPNELPIAMSTAFKYDTTEEVGDLFDLKESGFFYTRLSNPTNDAVERKVATLEGGVGALMTASGQSASMLSILNIAKAGDHVVASAEIYGGTYNLFDVTLRKLGIDFTFVNFGDEKAMRAAVKPNTRAFFGETLANPALSIVDIESVAKIAHEAGVPLILDNTFPTPYLCRPFEYGADIVVHASTKYLDGHATAVGGLIVDSGKFNWSNGKFSELTEPDESYHGIRYTETFGNSAYIVKARTQLMRDMGAQASPMNAFLTNLGSETLAVRMERHCENALKAAQFLKGEKKVKSVRYPALKGDPYFALCKKYMGGKGSGVLTIELESREKAVKFMNALKMTSLLVHVADVRTCALHPASATHRQLSDQALKDAGINPSMIRLSIGIEDSEDIIADFKQALAAV